MICLTTYVNNMVHLKVLHSLVLGLLLLAQTLRAQSFSQTSLREHINILASDSLMGREVGSLGEKRAANYISRTFESFPMEFVYPNGIQDFSVIDNKGDTLSSQNVVAILVGSDPALREEYIVVGAHYDHLGGRKVTIDGKDSMTIYRGADDNASGVAMLLDIAKMASQQPYLFKRSLVFVAFGAEEMGMIGSWYFVDRAFSPINQVVLMINIDMVGRSGTRNPFCAYTVTPNMELSKALSSSGESPLSAQPKVLGSDYFPSDHQHFYRRNIPCVLFTAGLHSDYHTPRDSPNLLDYKEMERRMAFVYSFMMEMANDQTWNKEKHDTEIPANGVYALSNVDQPPRFQRKDENHFVQQWINKYLRYPNRAVAQGIQGRVLVQFIVESNGMVTHVEVVESVDPLLDNEAVRVVSASPKWSAGRKNGKSVRTLCLVPVHFVLTKR